MNIQDIIPIQEDKHYKKVAKPRYIKPESVKQLEQDYFNCKYKDSAIPDNCRFVTKFRDDTANGLTNCLQAWCKINGAHFQRTNTQGQYDAKLKRFRRSGATKGVSDTMIVYKGKTLNIEIKIGRDKQSDDQKKIQASIENAGGIYWIIKTFDDFINIISQLNHKNN